jgi:putative iron-dependent peroxidase
MAEPQVSTLASSGTSALFLTLSVGPSEADAACVREVCAMVPTLVRSIGRRDSAAGLSCLVGMGADAWDRLVPGRSRPLQLHPFRALADGPRTAPATPGDVLLHVRAERRDFCHELVRVIIDKLGDAAQVIDETHGFNYMDNRDLIGLVDGTENPDGDGRRLWTIVGEEDPDHAGGTYVTVQRYVTDFAKWGAIATEEQERAIGRTKADDIELDDDVCPPSAHKERTKIVRDGEEHKIVRHNLEVFDLRPDSHLPGASTSPSPFRNDAAHDGGPGYPERCLGSAEPVVGTGRARAAERRMRVHGHTRASSAGEASGHGGRDQLQSNRSRGGGRGAGTSVGSPRWLRIFRMTTGSSIVATIGSVVTAQRP